MPAAKTRTAPRHRVPPTSGSKRRSSSSAGPTTGSMKLRTPATTLAPRTGRTNSPPRSSRTWPELRVEVWAGLCGVSLLSSMFGWSAISLLVYRTEGAAILAVGSGLGVLVLTGFTLLVGTR